VTYLASCFSGARSLALYLSAGDEGGPLQGLGCMGGFWRDADYQAIRNAMLARFQRRL
jgi:hypothetical protein